MPKRLLVLADAKVLAPLAKALGDGDLFEVVPLALGDPAAEAASDGADAVAVFYGTAQLPLATALQPLAQRVRARGGCAIAVLQRERSGQRDDCFRAGASDVLFMPLPRDEFVRRIAAAVSLSFDAKPGARAQVVVTGRGGSARVEGMVVADGVHAPRALPLQPGETVRLQIDAVQGWGLVARGSPELQVRFAGLTADEAAALRAADGVSAASGAGPSEPAVTPPIPTPVPDGSGPAPVRGAPQAGMPPGFAARHPARPPSERRVPAAAPAAGASSVAAAAASGPAADGGAALAGAPAPAGGPVEVGMWPQPLDAAACRAAILDALAGRPPAVPGEPAARAAGRVQRSLSAADRAAVEAAGPDSALAQGLGARTALDAAIADAAPSSAGAAPAMIDGEAFARLTALADAALAALQKEANAAVAAGKVDLLQLHSSASSALSRDLHALKQTADRLRGRAAAPRLGAGALDPEVLLPGQQVPVRPPPQAAAAPASKAELREFRGMEGGGGGWKKVAAALLLAAAAGLGVWAVKYSMPGWSTVSAAQAGEFVQSIAISGKTATVVVQPAWLEHFEPRLEPLVAALRPRGVTYATISTPDGIQAGLVDVTGGKAIRMNRPAK